MIITRSTNGDVGGDGRTLFGYAAVFNSDTLIRSWEGEFRESFSRGAFTTTLRERMPVLQFDHGHDTRVGSTPIGVFQALRQDQWGLWVEGRLFDNEVVEPVRQAIEANAIRGMSIRFEVVRDEWRTTEGGKLLTEEQVLEHLYYRDELLHRTINEVRLFEAGPVVFPAYNQTSVGVRGVAR